MFIRHPRFNALRFYFFTFKVEMESNTSWPQFEIDFITSVDTTVAIIETIAYIISIPLGLILIYGIMLNEKVGVDAQKRSLFNQLISMFFGCCGILCTVGSLFNTIRCWVGPLGPILGTIVSIYRRFFSNFNVFHWLRNSTLQKSVCD